MAGDSPRHRYACRPSLRLRRKEGYCDKTVIASVARQSQGAKFAIATSFLLAMTEFQRPSFPLAEERVVERSKDRVSNRRSDYSSHSLYFNLIPFDAQKKYLLLSCLDIINADRKIHRFYI